MANISSSNSHKQKLCLEMPIIFKSVVLKTKKKYIPALVCYCYATAVAKHHERGGEKTTQIYYLPVLEVRSLKEVPRTVFLLEAPEENLLPCPLQLETACTLGVHPPSSIFKASGTASLKSFPAFMVTLSFVSLISCLPVTLVTLGWPW